MNTPEIVVALSVADKLKGLSTLTFRRFIDGLSRGVELIESGDTASTTEVAPTGFLTVDGNSYSAIDTDAGIALVRPMDESERERFNISGLHGFVLADVLPVEEVKAPDEASLENAWPKATGAAH
ncbi:hypothetical protein RMN57_00475 [Kitasatospora sp. CM 4170]|uniref:Uncharacterized protein n=1 Tax=Kitasatospora aburaviensis TaxID=67265 RepID=A0ABW1F2M1_9ACTN|nr:hypothetical protein [Kitasatospora sp. CM 4170]WNM43283.1 hypothetical protein RMN57_00475 [Kitasatospora sp. CM 4170]